MSKPDPAVLYRKFDPFSPPTPEQYVEFAAVRGSHRLLDKIITRLDNSPEDYLLFPFSGHIGSGKSTELHHLTRIVRERTDGPRYFPIYLDTEDYLNLWDVSLTEVMLVVVAEVAEQFRSQLDIELKDGYIRSRIDEVRRLLFSEVELQSLDVEVASLKFGLSRLREEDQARQQVRKVIEGHKSTFIQEVNALFDEARKKLQQGQEYTDFLLIIDSLEKTKRLSSKAEGPVALKDLFITQVPQLLRDLRANAVLTIPLKLVRSHGPSLANEYGVDAMVVPMVKVFHRESRQKKHEEGRECLKEVLLKRLELKDGLDDWITPEAVDFLITYCGGHVRALVRFVRECASNVKQLPVSLHDAKISLRQTVETLHTAISREGWKKLAELEVSEDRAINPEDADFQNFLEQVIVMEYINGDTENGDPLFDWAPWYAPDPLVVELRPFKSALAQLNAAPR